MQQEYLHGCALTLEHFLDQVIEDVALTPTHLLQQIARVSMSLQREAKQLQTHQPAFCPSSHCLDHVLRELDSRRLLEEGYHLIWTTA